jgi:tyrosine-protein kinase Etk/Wzc
VTLKELILRIFRHWILMVVVALVVLAGVVAWTFLSTPRYRSTAVLRILQQPQALGLADQVGDLPGAGLLGLGGRDELETEVGVLRSWRVAEAVVDSLALTVQVRRPAGVRREVLEVLARGDLDRQGTLRLALQGDGAFRVTFREPREPRQDLGSVGPGEVVEVAGYRLLLSPSLATDAPRSVEVRIRPRYQAVRSLRKDVRIARQEGGSRLVEVSHTLPDPELAAAVVNAMVDEYVAYKTRAEGYEARFSLGELTEEVAAQALRLEGAEEKLRRFQEAHRVVAPEEEAVQQVRRVAQLQLQDDALRVERDALSRLLTLVEERARGMAAAPPSERPHAREDTSAPGEVHASDPGAYRQLATFPSLISNQGIQDLLMTLVALENERSALLGLRTEENRDVRRLSERIGELETQLFRVGTDYRESLDGHLASTGAALGRLNRELEALPEREMEYLRLVRDRMILGEAYLLLQKQLRAAEVQEALRTEGVRVVDLGLAAHPDDPAYPRPLVNLFLGLILAGAAGVGAALARDMWVE